MTGPVRHHGAGVTGPCSPWPHLQSADPTPGRGGTLEHRWGFLNLPDVSHMPSSSGHSLGLLRRRTRRLADQNARQPEQMLRDDAGPVRGRWLDLQPRKVFSPGPTLSVETQMVTRAIWGIAVRDALPLFRWHEDVLTEAVVRSRVRTLHQRRLARPVCRQPFR